MNPYDQELTPKQRENWENHGQPVHEAIGDVFDKVDVEHDLTVDDVRDYYVRLRRPKKRGDGMMNTDAVKLNGDRALNYIDKEIDDWFSPMSSLHGVMMARMMADDVERLEEVARVIALAKISLLSPEQQARLLQGHGRRARAYGLD